MVIYQSEDQSPHTVIKSAPEVIVYDNSNIQKSCNGVTTPLTYHFTKRAYSVVFKQTFKSLSLSDRNATRDDEIFQNLVGLIKGRIFYNINNWYRGLQFFHSFHHNKTSLSKIMGLSSPVNFVDDEEKSWWQKCMLLWGKFIDLPRLLMAFSALKIKVPKFLDKINETYVNFYKLRLSSMSLQDLKREKEKLDKTLLKSWITPIINELYILISTGNIAERLQKAGFAYPEEFVNSFLTEEQAFASLQPAKQMHLLAIKAAYYPELKHLISNLPDDIHKQVKIRFRDFYKEVMHFIAVYGDTTTGELKLETQTMRQNPQIFYRYLRDCLNLQISEIRASDQARKSALKTLEQRLSHLAPIHKKSLLSKVERFQKAVAYRETFKVELSRVFGMYRTLYTSMGVLFAKNQWVEKAEDIFYLSEDEIMLSGNGKEHVFATLIATRKQEFEGYKVEEIPSRILVSSRIISPAILERDSVPVIKGFDPEGIKAEVA